MLKTRFEVRLPLKWSRASNLLKLEEDTLFVVTKTCIYNFDPLKPHFYIVKLGFTGVYFIFLISSQKHWLWVLTEAVLTSTHNLCFEQKFENYQSFLSENFQFLVAKFSIYLNRRVFVMLKFEDHVVLIVISSALLSIMSGIRVR